MTKISRILVLVASGLIAAMLFVPLWKISLVAPQYPEGLAIEIWLAKITGDLRTINILNHYIGMMKIEPDSIPELKYFPYVFGGLAAFALAIAAIGRKTLMHLGTVAILSVALWSLYDFYAWEYRYGHDLDPDAPMKIEDSYDLPLIGTKQVTTVTASSFPQAGAIFFTTAIGLFLLGSVLNIRSGKRND